MKSPFLRSLTIFQPVVALCILAICAIVACTAPTSFGPKPKYIEAVAATPNVSPGAGQVVIIPFHISGQWTTTTTSVAKFNMPFPCTVLGVGTTARVSGGTSPTVTVDVKKGGSSILSAPISVTAGTYSEGTITTTLIADESAMTVDLTIGGTSPTWNDITLIITVVRR